MIKRDGDKTKRKLNKLLMIKKNLLESLTLLSKGERANRKSPEKDNEADDVFSSSNSIEQPDCSYMATWSNSSTLGCAYGRFEPAFQVDSGFYAGRRNTDHVVSKSSVLPEGVAIAPVNTWPRAHFFIGSPDTSEASSLASSTHVRREAYTGYPGGRFIPEDTLPLVRQDDDAQKAIKFQGARAVPRSHWRSQRQNRAGAMGNSSRPFTNPNADIVRYLNQFNDKTAFDLHAPYNIRHSVFVSSKSQLHLLEQNGQIEASDRFRTAGEPGDNVDRTNRVETKVSFDSDIVNIRPSTNDGELSDILYTYPDYSTSQMKSREFQPHQVTSMYTERSATDDSGSIFSSDADSDFMFFPCSSLRRALKGLTLTDPCDSDTVSEIPAKVSWKSDLCGSSLDDVTEQFFLDEDALSDDVFMDETSIDDDVFDDSSVVLTATSTHQKPKETRVMLGPRLEETSFQEQQEVESDLDESCNILIDSVIGRVSVATQTCDMAASTDDCPVYLQHSPLIVDTLRHEKVDSSISSNEETFSGINRELANTFDSLRRNSTQSKSRRLWKQRRDAKSKKKLDRACRMDTPEPEDHAKAEAEGQIFTFDTDQIQQPIYQALKKTPPPKPLRGILKNKTGRRTMEFPETAAVQAYPCTKQGGIPLVGGEVFSFNDARSPKDCGSILTATEKGLNACGDWEPSVIGIASDGCQIVKRTPDLGSDLGMGELNALSKTEEVYFVITPPSSSNMCGEVIAVRKNSVEMYKWTQSLRRRRQMRGRRELARYKTQGNNTTDHQNNEASIATI